MVGGRVRSHLGRLLHHPGDFSSTIDLRRKVLQYIRHHNKSCRPFPWRYKNLYFTLVHVKRSVGLTGCSIKQ